MTAQNYFMEMAEKYGGALWNQAVEIANAEMIPLHDALVRIVGGSFSLGPALTKSVQAEIERRIEQQHDRAFLQLQTAASPDARRYWFERLKFWKAQRSPERIAELERERGLRE